MVILLLNWTSLPFKRKFCLISGNSQSRCGCEFPHGHVSSCSDSLTSYRCDEGYEETTSWLRCSSSGQWVSAFGSSDGFCIPKSCPDQIPNGALSSSCSAKVGCSCNYSCDTGYTKTHANIVCETSANWSTNPHALCKRTNLPTADKTLPPEIVFSFIGVVFVIVVGSICITLIPDRIKRCITTHFTRLKKGVLTPSTPSGPVDHQHSVQNSAEEVTSQNYEVISLYCEYPTLDVDYTLREQEQDDESRPSSQMQLPSNNTNCNFVEDPPAYSSITPSIPEEAPPSYKQVTANPADYKL